MIVKITSSVWYFEYEVWLFLIIPIIIGIVNKIGWKYFWLLLTIAVVGLILKISIYNLVNVVSV